MLWQNPFEWLNENQSIALVVAAAVLQQKEL